MSPYVSYVGYGANQHNPTLPHNTIEEERIAGLSRAYSHLTATYNKSPRAV